MDKHSAARVFVTRAIPAAGIEVLRAAGIPFTIGQQDDERGLSRADLLEGIRTHDVLLALLTEKIDREALQANERLLGVANMAVGFDNVAVPAATELGIPVSNTPGVLTDTTADLAFALLLALARRIPQAHAYTVAGRWQSWGPQLFLGADVSRGGSGERKVLGIVGYGRIGAAMARRAFGFDMEVLACGRPGAPAPRLEPGVAWVELHELLARSDFVSLHAPLTPATRHLIGAAELQRMKPSAFLINTARGPIVDEAALTRALQRREIAGAALDVYEREPELHPGLRELDNVVLLPHIASATHDTRGAMARTAAQNAVAHARGERAPNAIDPEVYASPAYAARRRAQR
jgi:glyoxylate reductase